MNRAAASGVKRACKRDNSPDLLGFEWLYEHIVASEIHDLRPKPVIGEVRGDDHVGWLRLSLRIPQDVRPVAIRKSRIRDYCRHRAVIERPKSRAAADRLLYTPARWIEDPLESSVILI